MSKFESFLCDLCLETAASSTALELQEQREQREQDARLDALAERLRLRAAEASEHLGIARRSQERAVSMVSTRGLSRMEQLSLLCQALQHASAARLSGADVSDTEIEKLRQNISRVSRSISRDALVGLPSATLG